MRIQPKTVAAKPNQKTLDPLMTDTTQPLRVQSIPPRISSRPTISPGVRIVGYSNLIAVNYWCNFTFAQLKREQSLYL